MPPRPAATATSASAIGTRAATTVPNATTSTTSAASRPTASVPEVSVSALMNTASPPSSAVTPAARAGSIASASAASGCRTEVGRRQVERDLGEADAPVGRDGAGRERIGHRGDVLDLGDPRQRGLDGRPVVAEPFPLDGGEHGHGAAARRLRGSAPRAVPSPRSLWLPGATKSSTSAPPTVPASAITTAATTAQAAIVTHGLLALASPMRRMNRFMVACSFVGPLPSGAAPAVVQPVPLCGSAPVLSPAAGGVRRLRRGAVRARRSDVGSPLWRRRPRIRLQMGDRGSDAAYGWLAVSPTNTTGAPESYRGVIVNRSALPPRTALRVCRRSRGPFTRWPRAADAVLAVAMFLLTVFVVDGPGDTVAIRPIGDVPIAALLVFAVASAALYWRRRAPRSCWLWRWWPGP